VLWATGLAAGLSAALLGGVVGHHPRPRLIWNASASAPLGLYRIVPASMTTGGPVPGDLVVFQPPPALASYLDARRYLATGVPMLKHVAAAPGARLCRKGLRVTVDGRRVALARKRDSQGRPLPVWHGCRTLEAEGMFLLNPAADSMDGRYFGVLPAAGLLGRAIPLLTRDAPSAPLRWRGWNGALSPSPRTKG
jgi:conjugative transfer signal peptidase TraF